MIRSGLITAERVGPAVDTIERNATALTQIVEDVLDVSRIISGKIRLNVRALDMATVIHDSVEGILPAADAKGVRIEILVDPRAAPISGDPERMQQVIWNLVSNAVKFTGRGGEVQVRVAPVNAHLEIAVSDTGIGIPPDFLPHIFERFRQADSGTTRERGGLGLGLAIARHLIEMHGGTIQASSAGVGQGTTVRIELPLMVASPEARAERPVHPLAPSAGARIPVPDLHAVRVFAVDDDPDALRLVREILEAAGAQVFTANSAAEALAGLEAARPDVLLADLGMPRMDGFELIARIRRMADPALRDMPAAALTAYARSEDRAKALRSGFQVHLSKPIDPGELMAAIADLAGRSAPQDVPER
jgi:CheY-like chemotaxis protein